MGETSGRRCGKRTRRRTGCLTASDGTLADDVTPVTPGTEDDGSTGGNAGISIGIGILL